MGKLAEDWFAIVDMSIETGTAKALVVLRVRLSTWARKESQALTLDDCEAIGVDVRTEWDAESVKESLEGIFRASGTPAFIIKDQGSDITALSTLVILSACGRRDGVKKSNKIQSRDESLGGERQP